MEEHLMVFMDAHGEGSIRNQETRTFILKDSTLAQVCILNSDDPLSSASQCCRTRMKGGLSR